MHIVQSCTTRTQGRKNSKEQAKLIISQLVTVSNRESWHLRSTIMGITSCTGIAQQLSSLGPS